MCEMISLCHRLYRTNGSRFNISLCTLSGIGPCWTLDPRGKIGGTLHAIVVYEESKFANPFVRLGPAEQRIDANSAGVAGLATATPV